VIGTTSSRWYSGDGAERALDIAGIGRFDSIWMSPRPAETIAQAFDAIGVAPDRGVVVTSTRTGAQWPGRPAPMAIARSAAGPELRKGGAHTGVADQHELPGPING
jgi:hypothetical protein